MRLPNTTAAVLPSIPPAAKASEEDRGHQGESGAIHWLLNCFHVVRSQACRVSSKGMGRGCSSEGRSWVTHTDSAGLMAIREAATWPSLLQ